MRFGRRKFWLRLFEIVALILVAANIAAYFAVVVPIAKVRASEEQRFTSARKRNQELRARVAQLERYQTAVPATAQQLEDFVKEHVPSRRQGFSRAARLVRRHTENAGIELAGISYKLESAPNEPLRRLSLEIDVMGPFANVLEFAHAIETASELVIVRNFNLGVREDRLLTLRLGADLYLQP